MIRSVLAGTVGALFDLVLPPRCSLCDSLLDATGSPMCEACQDGLEPLLAPVCERCGQPVPSPGSCGGCADLAPSLTRIRSAVAFGGPASEAILGLKMGGRTELAAYLAEWIAGFELTGPLSRQADLLVPIPLHRSRLARRGFNQSALIARRLARVVGARLDVAGLLRLRATASQSRMGGQAERSANVGGAFGVARHHDFSDRRICLVDDVVTTGATLAAAAEAVHEAGAKAVTAVTFARTVQW